MLLSAARTGVGTGGISAWSAVPSCGHRRGAVHITRGGAQPRQAADCTPSASGPSWAAHPGPAHGRPTRETTHIRERGCWVSLCAPPPSGQDSPQLNTPQAPLPSPDWTREGPPEGPGGPTLTRGRRGTADTTPGHAVMWIPDPPSPHPWVRSPCLQKEQLHAQVGKEKTPGRKPHGAEAGA